MHGTVGAARTLVLWGANGVKNAALDATEVLFTRVVRFYHSSRIRARARS
jgi:hypothetical protein